MILKGCHASVNNPQTFANIYQAKEKDFIKSKHRIYHDTERPTSISFGVLKK